MALASQKPARLEDVQVKNASMTIGELEKISGFQRSTIHHYVRTGLLHQPYKSGQTMAYYDKDHLRRLEEIQKIKIDYLRSAKTSRVPLDIIKCKILKMENHGPEQPGNNSGKKRANRKEELIEAALRLCSSRGYSLTNVRDIVKEAGVTAPTFYYYFNDKRELFVEAIEYVIDNFKKDSMFALKNEVDLTKRTSTMFRVFYENYSKVGEILNQLRAGVAINDQWAKEKLAKLYRELTSRLIKEIQDSISLGHIRDIDPDLIAFFIVTLDEAVINRAMMDEKYTLEKLLMFLADFLCNGFFTLIGKESWRPLR